jgi:hypothetical protein
LILGSSRQVEKVDQFNTTIKQPNQNWKAYQLTNVNQAIIDIQSHKKLGNKIRVLLIQAHAQAGNFKMFEGIDGTVDTKSLSVGDPINSDDEPLDAFQINEFYIPELNRINNIQSDKEKSKQVSEFKSLEPVKRIESFLSLVNEIEDNGTLILNGCHVFDGEQGKNFSDTILKLTNKRVSLLGSQDYCSDINTEPITGANRTPFGGRMIPQKYAKNGYMLNSTNTNKNLKLNGTGEKLYELVPLEIK